MGVPCVFGAVKVEEGKPNKKEEAKKICKSNHWECSTDKILSCVVFFFLGSDGS